MAPRVGLEPTTTRLTAGCSTIELSRSVIKTIIQLAFHIITQETFFSQAHFQRFSWKNIRQLFIIECKTPYIYGVLKITPGNDLLSQPVTRQVPSARRGLTAVFGMGTGGSPSPLSPGIFMGLHPQN